uniref:Mannose-1-phosphate guanyltransferase C-terminal domain-containing protein n=1 Tax=Physcomitrium patens TaxID=3218 RepID=A0A7I4EQP8_PHYPA
MGSSSGKIYPILIPVSSKIWFLNFNLATDKVLEVSLRVVICSARMQIFQIELTFRIVRFCMQGGGDYNAKLGITILGEDVAVEDEVVVVNCIVLPHKTLNISVQDEIIL